MYEELVKRLRDISNSDSNIKSNYIGLTMLQAADAIEEQGKVISAQLNVIEQYKKMLPRWIPVTERLPEEDTLVLVWRYNGLPYVSRRTDSTYWLGLGRDSGITHWMPLPETPKEET